MQRHDGIEYIPEIFNGRPPQVSQVIGLMRFEQESMTWNFATMIAQTLLMAEVVRTYPAEIRMILRLRQRKKPNMAEIFFILIKYLTLIAVILDILVTETFYAKSDFDCRSWAWTSSTFYFVCSSLVFCVIGWRARIIFRTSNLASYLISAGLVVQFAIAMWTNYRVDKADALSPAGTCGPSAQVHGSSNGNENLKLHFWERSTFWFLLYNTVFELTLLVACCMRLKKTSSGPGGLTKIAKALFVNNVHYMAGVETCNVIELIMLIAWAASLPPLHITSIAMQIVMGLQMLIGEQEAVHSPSCSGMTYESGAHYASNSSYGKPAHHATASNMSFSSPSRTWSYFKRPGTANTATDVTISEHRGYKGALSSFGSVPAYVKNSPEDLPPQLPPKTGTNYEQEVEVSIDMSPLPPKGCPLATDSAGELAPHRL
ncbi:uncharacterized protein MEPE_01466 [Melanopsichium pennsylvanicum]|uniref:Uncharacterized protein n=2 Tax=Melanopsichium pennsylvanicum TaxID=63383 RepID=A0AAJ4XHT0_9BASI|nr:hypothetical protein BN887_03233 [Melanopsichium pennsylvanicum 4]SNX82760.1 uncharacterized protein MEPE_01466 [Melanopsichium pennsylvanicum]